MSISVSTTLGKVQHETSVASPVSRLMIEKEVIIVKYLRVKDIITFRQVHRSWAAAEAEELF